MFGMLQTTDRWTDRQAGSRRGLRRAMLHTHAWLKLSWTDTQMDGQTDRQTVTAIAWLY